MMNGASQQEINPYSSAGNKKKTQPLIMTALKIIVAKLVSVRLIAFTHRGKVGMGAGSVWWLFLASSGLQPPSPKEKESGTLI
jgi:hypothetical protein